MEAHFNDESLTSRAKENEYSLEITSRTLTDPRNSGVRNIDDIKSQLTTQQAQAGEGNNLFERGLGSVETQAEITERRPVKKCKVERSERNSHCPTYNIHLTETVRLTPNAVTITSIGIPKQIKKNRCIHVFHNEIRNGVILPHVVTRVKDQNIMVNMINTNDEELILLSGTKVSEAEEVIINEKQEEVFIHEGNEEKINKESEEFIRLEEEEIEESSNEENINEESEEFNHSENEESEGNIEDNENEESKGYIEDNENEESINEESEESVHSENEENGRNIEDEENEGNIEYEESKEFIHVEDDGNEEFTITKENEEIITKEENERVKVTKKTKRSLITKIMKRSSFTKKIKKSKSSKKIKGQLPSHEFNSTN